ncbi:glycosyltransferase family 2 protein [Flavobacterium limnophilum]|uniref:glycosyltransferase family 2 protein n=1 Tax=Flavobacterium limnophilum TaxID=3003262 RepID=UPI00248228BC|nr:glycosyltransferase [Flavobacterium limnophilum]
MRPLISIIIPTFNRAELISETLDSILAQTYTNWECIIIDDGSTDNTDEVVGSYVDKDSRFQYHQRPLNKLKGPNSCRNYGFEKSKGEFINWFDSDDLYNNNALERLVNSYSDEFDLVVCRLEKVNSKTKIKIKDNPIFTDNLLLDYFVGNVTFYVSGPLWRKSLLLKQLYLFDEEIRYLDDWDFNLRMLYNNPKIKYLDESLIKYCIHSESLSHEVSKLNYEEIKSEIFAREKQLKIISENKKVNKIEATIFVKNRYKYILRDLMVVNYEKKKELFKLLLKKQVELHDFYGILKTIAGFVSYSLFNKGYFFYK